MRQALLMLMLLTAWSCPTQTQAQTQAQAQTQTQSVRAQISGGLLEIGVDYVRLDTDGSRVKLTHTTQTGRQLFFVPISEWTDHPVLSVLFRPDGCRDLQGALAGGAERRAILRTALDQGLIGVAEYTEGEQLLRPFGSESNRLSCLVLGTDTVTLPAGVDLREGTWTVLYALNEVSRHFVSFRVPPTEETNIEKEVLKQAKAATGGPQR